MSHLPLTVSCPSTAVPASKPVVADTPTAAFPEQKQFATVFVSLPSNPDNGKLKGRQDMGLLDTFPGYLLVYQLGKC